MNKGALGIKIKTAGTQGISIAGRGSTQHSNKRRHSDTLTIAGSAHSNKRARQGYRQITGSAFNGSHKAIGKRQHQAWQQRKQSNISQQTVQQRIRQAEQPLETFAERLPTIAEVGATAMQRRSFFGQQMEDAYKEALRSVLGLEMQSLAREMGMEATVEIRRASHRMNTEQAGDAPRAPVVRVGVGSTPGDNLTAVGAPPCIGSHDLAPVLVSHPCMTAGSLVRPMPVDLPPIPSAMLP
ncbi:hypothetical protein EC988_007126, partial [Linderina pennispora]